ncbi:MAG: ATP-binding cassette domain-containing protein [Spirochaetia bacterium]|jgi:ABC-type transporter Mla maintaining outer membrane lipid asymmetry ATPase subunit MlaF|nr:ATP-binding cassette domain-containing protein [Spirochaetia bacterium]
MEKLLIFDNVSCKDYGKNALDQISFDIEYGETVVVFGPEHSGTHLLCPLIAGFIEILDGNIIYKGSSIKNMDYLTKLEHKQKIGYLPHAFGLINNMNVEQNISLPLQYHSEMTNTEIAEYINILISELHLETCRDLRPIKLSRSEMLKTAYARATVFDPDLLMIEHAFERQSLIQLLSLFKVLSKRVERKEKSVLFITYEPHKFVRTANKFIMFFDNKIVFSGGPDDFLNSNNPYLAQYRDMSEEGPMLFL